MVLGQMTLDLSDNRLASFVDTVNFALVDCDKSRYGWLREHPIRYGDVDGVAWIASDYDPQVNANVSFMPAHDVLRGIANAIETRECCCK